MSPTMVVWGGGAPASQVQLARVCLQVQTINEKGGIVAHDTVNQTKATRRLTSDVILGAALLAGGSPPRRESGV